MWLVGYLGQIASANKYNYEQGKKKMVRDGKLHTYIPFLKFGKGRPHARKQQSKTEHVDMMKE